MFTAIIPILCNINPCMLFLISIEKKKRSKETSEIGGQRSKPILRNWGCYSSGSYRWSWLLHLLNQESRATTKK